MERDGIGRRALLKAAVLGLAGVPSLARARRSSGAGGSHFLPRWDSLIDGYQAPQWFRDAKFGIWAHWTAQSVPEFGDWYARKMYLQGNPCYKHHLANYGHPADVGFMEMYPRWKAEKFDPDALLDLYVKAGAKYFVAMANHHDNFDCYNSKFHAWNSTRIGPKRDIVGLFAKAARSRGLRFGVSNHSGHTWHWFQPAYGYDPEGPRQGQRYDAFKLTKAMGKGKWWHGLDPQHLYGGRVMPMPNGISSIAEADAWHEKHDYVWDESLPAANPAFAKAWFLRCKDLIDSYRPDLLYFDDTGLPLGQTGLDITAYYYNSSIKRNGKVDVVVTGKNLTAAQSAGIVNDMELGLRADIEPHVWQTDTCIGDWHYSRPLYDANGYRTATYVIHELCDVVSKNGNLLLNIPVRGDGSIDEKEVAIVEGIASWMSRFSEAIYGTRPWRVAGEGPTVVFSGQFSEQKTKPFTAEDIRYTARGGTLYAMTLGKPEVDTLTLSAVKEGHIERVEVVGDPTALQFTQDGAGLHVTLPSGASHAYGIALKIAGTGLV
jgi:alpha-L-fucosidase